MSTPGTDPDFDVLLLGTDMGIYGLARAFHERYGTVSTVISRTVAGAVKNSQIIRAIDLGEAAQRPQTLAALEDFGSRQQAAGRTTLILSNADTFSRMLSDHADWLRQWYLVPAVAGPVLDVIADKLEFYRVCEELGIPHPRSVVQDFRGADDPAWEPGEVDLDFPVVLKPSIGAAYEGLQFEGKQKIYKVDSAEELRRTLLLIRDGGFRDRFIVQELIPGDDTAMRSVTAYVDSSGEVTLLATAHVLLQEHTPLAIGNPAAMVTTPFPQIMEQAERLLKHVGYRGFANFDVKVDPRDGVPKFFEVNPRIGRNNYYVTAAGANVAEFVVTDLVQGLPHEKVVVDTEVLYSVLPMPLLRRYLSPEHRALVRRVAREHGVHHPLRYRDSLWRKGYVLLQGLNYYKKYATYYPRPTESGF